ncbi:AAA family ATPase [Flagellimonas aequoris]|uniref:ATPase n=1 Tax=Flagellimonas aequoris TaxID=2306997 RepID=A0A418N5K6_9FLAO|nr:AAA family ATPase [Allomuricauda aequoris]RIV69381.1 ATPase [Allomuricauda aequoris]TXK01052.1 AAA family ATPase [Allomuricauda aequoris]
MKDLKPLNTFYVITGGPGVGKTTLLHELQNRGATVVPEIARELIKEQQEQGGKALPWKNRKLYMEIMFQRSMESFQKAIVDFKGTGPVFFDRGFLDALCYAALEGIPIDQEMRISAEKMRYNTNVFILPPWQEIYQTDEQRKQDWNEAVFTYNKMIQTYRGYQYDLVEVPKSSILERADFILDFIQNN